MASPKRLWLLCFSLKNGFSKTTFGKTSLEESESELKRSPAKQTFILAIVGASNTPSSRGLHRWEDKGVWWTCALCQGRNKEREDLMTDIYVS